MPTSVPGTPRRFSLLLALLAMLASTPVQGLTQDISPDLYESLRYRHIGPVGNRIASVAGVPGDPMTYYAGAASGGIWKSEDGGEYWEPIFERETDHSIGALAVWAQSRSTESGFQIWCAASSKSSMVTCSRSGS